jgi:hypothetical protein
MPPAGLLQIDATILQQIHGNSPQCLISITVHMVRRVLHRLKHDPEKLNARSGQISLKRFQVWRQIRVRTPNSGSPRQCLSVLVSPRFAKPRRRRSRSILRSWAAISLSSYPCRERSMDEY